MKASNVKIGQMFMLDGIKYASYQYLEAAQ